MLWLKLFDEERTGCNVKDGQPHGLVDRSFAAEIDVLAGRVFKACGQVASRFEEVSRDFHGLSSAFLDVVAYKNIHDLE
ncbi:hypothetical protein [Rothia nasisuis]|uniref:hypothetical protein n=1 Tax=Rothia nasisuis TaxID=2109647 RepID=UPI001F41E173|nr:hypothetical protein [Rothia nasisuis]